MTFEEQLRHAIRSHVDEVAPPIPNANANAVMGRQRGARNPRVVAIPVAVLAIVGGVLGGASIITDDEAVTPEPKPLGAMNFSHGLRAYTSPDGDVFLGGRRFDGSDLDQIDTDGTVTPYGIVCFEDGQAHLLDERGERTPIGPTTDDAPNDHLAKLGAEGVFHPSAKADATRPFAAWTEYYDDHVTVRMYDFETSETVATYDVECGSKCEDVRVDVVDSGYAFIKTGDGTYAWDAVSDNDEATKVAGPGTDVVDVHSKTLLYSGKPPDPDPDGPIDGSWTLVKSVIEAQLSHDGRYILYSSPTLKPIRGRDEPVRLDAKGLGFYTFDTDGSVLAATYGDPAKVYDCVLSSGKCARLEDLPTDSGDPIFVGADM